MRENREGTMLISLFHTCASKQHHDITFLYQWEFFIMELGLYIPMMAFLQLPQVFMTKQVGCTPTQFLLLSFHTLIALVHPFHGNPYSLTLISINGHLHSPLIRLVDVRLSSPPFCFLHTHHSIPHIVLFPWLTLMYCVKVEKFENSKV